MARAGRVDNGASMEVSKSRAQTDLELPVRGEEFPAVMVLQAVLGFVDSVTFQELSFRAERGVCCARERQRARFLATRGMTSSKRSQIIFVSEIALALEIALVLEIGWDDQAF